MSTNVAARLAALLPQPALQVGTVTASSQGVTTLSLPGGATVRVRGEAETNTTAWFRGGVIESTGPALPIQEIEV